MADFAYRLKRVEKKLDFIMNSIRMKGAVGTGLLKADGTPDIRILEGTLAEFYATSKLAEEIITEDQIDPSVVEAIING